MTGIFLGDTEPSKIFVGDTEVSKVFVGDTQIRPNNVPALCFTAKQSNSTIKLTKINSPTSINIETTTNGSTWTDYTFGTDIVLSNVGDKVYFRNKSETPTGFSTSSSNSYKFVMSGLISASGDINYLLCKNSTTTLSDYCFYRLFDSCTSLVSAPELPATTLGRYSYCHMFDNTSITSAPDLPATSVNIDNTYAEMFINCTSLINSPKISATVVGNSTCNSMFQGCSSLVTAPSLTSITTLGNSCFSYMFRYCTSLTSVTALPATRLNKNCYRGMFQGCSSIKVSATQDSDYTQSYRLPTTGTGTEGSYWNRDMFASTGGTFTGGPSVNTTYYVHKDNTIV